MSDPILNTALAAGYTPSAPILLEAERVALNFRLAIAGPAAVRVLWYFEFTEDNPYDPATLWFPETAEEDIGNGDVRMPMAIRRFSTQGGDADLPAGTHYRSAQFKRTHKFMRIQMAGAGCVATVWNVFGTPPFAP